MCFSPDKYTRLKKYHDENTRCILTNVVKINSNYKLTNSTVVKPKTLLFEKDNKYEYHSLDDIINEFQQNQYVNVVVKVISAEAIDRNKNLSLREYSILDDGVTEIKLTNYV